MSLGVPDQPLISVVMPVYNAERYVAQAITSILTQTYSHFEFIIVDDGSTDGSATIVRDFAARDARIRPFFPAHSGQARALNTGITTAQGELIAFMEHDDIALPERFAIQLDWMRRTGVVICGGCLKSFGDTDGFWWFPETHKAICHELLFGGNALHLGSALIQAEVAKVYASGPEEIGGAGGRGPQCGQPGSSSLWPVVARCGPPAPLVPLHPQDYLSVNGKGRVSGPEVRER
jgi:glycosyltransferase involved in cell wall biosynthesis